jgi:hypothetical protein
MASCLRRGWNAPSDQMRLLKRLQGHRCASTGRRLLRSSEVDHRTPLFRVWRDHRDLPWPTLLGFWGLPNLQVINRKAHLRKSSDEASERRTVRPRSRAAETRPRLTSAEVIFYLRHPLD